MQAPSAEFVNGSYLAMPCSAVQNGNGLPVHAHEVVRCELVKSGYMQGPARRYAERPPTDG